MTLQQLDYIVALDKQKNFVRASEQCFVTQPTLTMQVRKLEQEIGFRLFDRSRKPLEATDLGRRFIDKARLILKEVEELKSMVNSELDALSGDYRLGIIPTLAPYLLPKFLPAFIRAFPDVHLSIQEMQSTEIIERLKNNRLDLALLSTPLNEQSIREIPLFNEPFLLYLPVNDPLLDRDLLTPESLNPENLLLLAEGHCFREQALNLCQKDIRGNAHKFSFESGSIESLKRLVDIKMGYTLVPELSVQGDIKTKPSIRRFENPQPSREISLVCHNSFHREKLLEVLRDTIQQHLPENLRRVRRFIRVKWR